MGQSFGRGFPAENRRNFGFCHSPPEKKNIHNLEGFEPPDLLASFTTEPLLFYITGVAEADGLGAGVVRRPEGEDRRRRHRQGVHALPLQSARRSPRGLVFQQNKGNPDRGRD